MKIHIPNSAWLGNIDPFIKSLDTSDDTILKVTSHKKWVSVHPVVLCMIAACGLEIRRKNQSKKPIEFEVMEAKSKHYFERMGLFRMLGLDSQIRITKHEPSGRFIPLKQVFNSTNLDEFIKDVIPLLHLSPEQAEPIKYILSELVRNVFEHAAAINGAIVCAQYYEKSNTIRIGVVDTGFGIKKTLAIHHPRDDFDALRLALTPGITGTTHRIGGTATNAGAGLFFVKSLAKISRDFFLIYSGAALYKLLKNPKGKLVKLTANPLEDHFSSELNLPYWNGTVVAIDLCLNETLNFTRLLEEIREVYRKGKKEQSKIKYKKARFI